MAYITESRLNDRERQVLARASHFTVYMKTGAGRGLRETLPTRDAAFKRASEIADLKQSIFGVLVYAVTDWDNGQAQIATAWADSEGPSPTVVTPRRDAMLRRLKDR